MESLKQTIMRRDNLSSKEADEQIADAKVTLQQYLIDGNTTDAYDICQEFFGLEPEYIKDLM